MDFVAWYRNPTGGQRALRIPFETGSGYGKLYPDIIIAQRNEDTGEVRTSIVDPHGHHLSDAADKLRGLASYAERHGFRFARIVGVIRDSNDEYRMLDLKDATIRSQLATTNGREAIEALFSVHGAVYG